MHFRRPASLFCLIVLFLTVGFLAGCGGSQSDGNNSGGGNSQAKEQGSNGRKGQTPKVQTVLGKVVRVNTETRKIIVRKSMDEQDKEPFSIKVPEGATIELDDKQADLTQIKKGQQAQISYFVRNWGNQAREVRLFSADGATGGQDTG